MSDYGLLVKNTTGDVQIDSLYRNLSYDESGTSATITNATGVGGVYFTTVSITNSSLVPLILIKPDDDHFVAIKQYRKSGTNFINFDMWTECTDAGTVTTDVDWKCYRENRTASGDNYGLLVYNPDGEVCFDSGKSYFKVHSIHTIDLTSPAVGDRQPGDSETVTHSGISNPYYIITPTAYFNTLTEVTATTFRQIYWNIGVKRVSSTSVEVGWYSFYDNVYSPGVIPPEFAKGLNPTMKLVVCDTT